MKREWFNFGDQWAVIGALTVLALVLAANVGYFIGRDFGKKSESRNQEISRQINQEQENNYLDPKD